MTAIPANPSLTEVIWSPDAAAFVVNSSEGGLVGTWGAYVRVLASDGSWAMRDVRRLIEPAAKGVVQCATDEVPNLGAAGWLEEGRELLIVLEVPPHSSCRNLGALVGFRVSRRDWSILERIPESILRAKWGALLGPRFRS